MHIDDNGVVLSPTDLTRHLGCAHATTLDLRAARGELQSPAQADEALELVFRLGLEHEQRYLERLRAAGRAVEVVPEEATLVERAALTERLLAAGAEIVYQATFFDGANRGHADFLVRADRPSSLGSWSYDVADTKLARRMNVAALLQMAQYGAHLQRLQGQPPKWLTVVTGDGQERPFRYADAAGYQVRALAALRSALAEPVATVPQPCLHCAQCRWAPRCEAQWRAEDHLSLVAFMRTDHRVALEEAGVRTVAQLAASSPELLPATIGAPSRVRLQAQAALQVRERERGEPYYELLEPAPGLGLLRLPTPSPGDVYLDFEGDPYAEEGEGREYLAGLWDRNGEFTTFWAHCRDEEARLAEGLLAELVARLDADPGMHVYHYAPYERSALARLTQRYGVGEAHFDRLLRGETLVDLYGVVRQGLRISKASYSIKKLEAFYWGGVRASGDQPEDVADALSSVVAYERWLVSRDPDILEQIAAYNRDDVRSTHDLHAWLEERRSELEGAYGAQPRPSVPDGIPSTEQSEAEAAEAALAGELRDAGHQLLAGLVGWHRRESKPQWWDFYRLGALTDDELVSDTAALGDLGEPVSRGPLPKPARSTIWRYSFPPQDTKVKGKAVDVDTHKALGDIVGLDPAAGWLELKVGTNKQPPRPRGIGPGRPVSSRELQDSLQRTAREVLAGDSPLGLRLIQRAVPPGTARIPGESAAEAVLRVGRKVTDSVLAVQGPPGSGKTTVGAELIRAILDDGLKVGVTAQSHAVIGNLLRAVGRRALQKCDEEDYCGAPAVERAATNDQVVDALGNASHNLVGGSAWLWSRDELTGLVDVVVIDEAGQFSLANAVAVCRCARGLVLLGDPQQLAQPSQAVHPDGAGISVLEHLLDGAATIPADKGVFLDRTWRMHPDLAQTVSELMYEGRLEAVPGTEAQRVEAAAPLSGSGVRWVPVPHVGNAAASSEEADVVAKIVDDLHGETWMDRRGEIHRVGLDDILVVAPYNAHVGRLRATLPAGARVGTVDKFQGQEAPVVIYSMASSSAEDAPRGIDFLYDLHRLNVAISRARCLAVLVGSPRLLDAAVRTPEQLRRVNALIKVVDHDDATWKQ
ncbi:MAG TPA: TM0106 family RecB-like putative nuclease [Acidimicrobiales bacterium]|nr:TM0106 family RecB-like putative nuclease [Acidimicrobiales bacterium]